jgi:O-antigen/teichoic acid export membrane protein
LLSIKRIKLFLVKGAIPLAISDAAAKGTSGVVNILIARFFGTVEYGHYAAAAAICSLFLLITGIGFEEEYTRRNGAGSPDGAKSFSTLMVCLLIASVLSYLSLAGFIFTRPYNSQIKDFSLIIGLSLIAYRFQQPFRNYCLIQDKLIFNAGFQSLLSLLLLGATALLIYFQFEVDGILLAQLVLYSIFLILWFVWLPERTFEYHFTLAEIKDFFLRSIPFAFTNIIWIIFFNFATFILSVFRTSDEAGQYAIVFKIISVTYIFGYATANSFTPSLYKNYLKDPKEFNRQAVRLLSVSLLIATFSAIALYTFSARIISLLVGDDFSGSIAVMKVLSVSTFFRFINFSLCEIVTTSFQQKIRVWFELGMLLVYVLLNLMVIPRFGLMGAAWSTLFAEVSLSIGVSVYLFYRKEARFQTI